MARPHKILLMAGSMEGGGSERQTLNLLKHLNREMFSPHLFLSYRRGELLEEIPEDVPVTAFWDTYQESSVRMPGQIHRAQVRCIRDLLINHDIDLLYDRTFHMSLLARPAARGLRCRRVATIVSPPDQDLPSSESRFVMVKRWLLGRSYRRAHRVVTVSEAVAQSASQYYGIPRNHFTTIHSPIDVESIEQLARDSAHCDLDPVDVNIACVGRMTQEKGHAQLLSAIARLKQHDVFDCLRLWLIGDGPLRAQLEKQTKQLGLDGTVRFTGRMSSAIPLLSECQLVCAPSLYEGLPNVVLEAMTLGIPVIASDAGGTRELIGDNNEFGTLVPANDVDAIAAAIQEFTENPEPAQQKAEAASARVRAEHDVSVVLPRIQDLLLDVLD